MIEWSIAEAMKCVLPSVALDGIIGEFENLRMEDGSATPAQLQFAVRTLSFAVKSCGSDADLKHQLESQLDDTVLPVLLKVWQLLLSLTANPHSDCCVVSLRLFVIPRRMYASVSCLHWSTLLAHWVMPC